VGKTVWFVSRQVYWGVDEEDSRCVEIAFGGRDYSNADMLDPKYKGEGQEYSDPREAVTVAIEIEKLWRKDDPKASIHIDYGATGGSTMPFLNFPTNDELIAWADKTFEQMPKCDQCGGHRDAENYYRFYDDLDLGKFCSKHCAEKAQDYAARNRIPCPICEGEKYEGDAFCNGSHCCDDSFLDKDPNHIEHGHVIHLKTDDPTGPGLCEYCVTLATAKQGVN